MLIINTAYDKCPDTKSMCTLLMNSNQEHGFYMDYDRTLEYHFFYRNHAARILKMLGSYLKPNSPIKYDATAGDIKAWIAMSRINSVFSLTDKGNDISLDAESINGAISSGILTEEQKRVLTLWQNASTCQSRVGQVGTLLSKSPEPESILSCERNRLLRIDPIWTPQNTTRFASSDPAIQNFMRDIQDLFTVPQGFVMLSSDSGQIEPKITQSTIMKDAQIIRAITLFNDAYYGLLWYCQAPIEIIRSKTLDFTVPEVNEEMKIQRQKLKTMGNAILYGSTDDKGGDPLYKAYINRIGRHPDRLKYVEECTKQLMRGDYTFYTEFGEPVDVRNASNATGKYGAASDSAKMNHFIRSAINVKMQGTAAGLMKLALQDENKYIMRNNLDSYIFASVHDAIKTAVAENEVDEHLEYFKQVPSYQVNDWIPIYADADVGPHRVNPVFSEIGY